MAGYEAQPSCHVASLAELAGVTSGRKQSGGTERPNTRYCHQPPCPIVFGCKCFDLPRNFLYAYLEPLQIFEQISSKRRIVGVRSFSGSPMTRGRSSLKTPASSPPWDVLEPEGAAALEVVDSSANA